MTTLPNASWINPERYPFTTKAYRAPAGTMRYVDEGTGSPIVMVHGNPAWSYVYRKLILALRSEFRCIAPDHLGFGQSEHPEHFSYLPKDHAENLAGLLDSLVLKDLTLVVNDWGGPTGLSYAITRPEKVKRLVILNTWLWPVDDDWYYQGFSGFMGGPIGRWLCRERNGFVNLVMPKAYGRRELLTDEDLRHYRDALPTPESRRGTWVFPKQIIESTPWLASLWEKRALLADKPALLAWGMKDIAFREKELKRWQEALPHAEVLRFEQAGHYVGDEEPEAIAAGIRKLMLTDRA